MARRLVHEDVTDLGEQLAELHLETLATELDMESTHHYRRALEHYEQAKDKLASSTTTEDVFAIEQLLQDARYHRAVVLARVVPVCAVDARRLAGGEDPQIRMVRLGDRHVPVHEAGGVEALLDRHRGLMGDRSTSRNRKSLAEAYINQSAGGMNGPRGGGLY